MDYKKSNIKKIKDYYKTSISEGLSKEQVTLHRKKYGSNVFQEVKEKSIFEKLLKHLLEVMNLVLIIVSVPAFYLSIDRYRKFYKANRHSINRYYQYHRRPYARRTC